MQACLKCIVLSDKMSIFITIQYILRYTFKAERRRKKNMNDNNFYTLNRNFTELSFLPRYCVSFTSLDGFRRTSPTPPPLLRPWLNTVTMHMSKESHTRSLSSITTADGWTATEAIGKYQHRHRVITCLDYMQNFVCSGRCIATTSQWSL